MHKTSPDRSGLKGGSRISVVNEDNRSFFTFFNKYESLHNITGMIMLSVILFAVAAINITRGLVILSPQRAEVLEGESVLFTCASERNTHFSTWTWSSSNNQYIDIVTFFGDRCKVIGSNNTSHFSIYCNETSTSILIRNITRSRHGERWDCKRDGSSSNFASVYVTVPLTFVMLDLTGSTISPKENSKVTISCSTSFARPAPNITWYLTEKMPCRECVQPLLDSVTTQYTNNTEELFSTRSEILLHVNRSFDKRRIYCSANNRPGITVTSANILFDVQYISLFVKGFEGEDIITVEENDTVQFTCIINIVASIAKLKFSWKTVLVEGFGTSNLTYTFHRVSCRDSGDYTCVARNALNYEEPLIGHLTMLVKCPPHALPNTPVQEYVLAKPGDIVAFIVDIIAYPEPRMSDYVWMKLTNANWTIINNNLHTEISIRGLQTNLTIKSVTEEDYGKYLLTVTNGLGLYSQNFNLKNAGTEERANNNVIAIAIGSVVGIAVLVGIIGVAIFLTRKANQKRAFPCISIITKWRRGKNTSSIWKTSSSAAAESNENQRSSKPKNIYEQIQRNGEEIKEYQEIQFGEDDKCVYKNMQLCPPPASS